MQWTTSQTKKREKEGKEERKEDKRKRTPEGGGSPGEKSFTEGIVSRLGVKNTERRRGVHRK